MSLGWVRSKGEELVPSRGAWATIGLGMVRVRQQESASSAECNQGSPAMMLNNMTCLKCFLLGALQVTWYIKE